MKQLLIIIFICISFSCAAQTKDTTQKIYTIKFSEKDINSLYSALEFSKSALPTSDASAKNVTEAIRLINEMEAIIAKQYQEQVKKK